MPLVRYRSPDDSAFVVFDQSRFRVEHGTFSFRPAAIRERVDAILEEHRGWDLRAMKLVQENRRLESCAEWLESLPTGEEGVVVPDLPIEPALDLVADRLIADGEYVQVECPACLASYSPGEVLVEPFAFEEDGTTLRGRRTACGLGDVLHASRDSVEVAGLELDED